MEERKLLRQRIRIEPPRNSGHPLQLFRTLALPTEEHVIKKRRPCYGYSDHSRYDIGFTLCVCQEGIRYHQRQLSLEPTFPITGLF